MPWTTVIHKQSSTGNITRDVTAFVEPAWQAPLRKYLPGALLLFLVVLMVMTILLPLHSLQPAQWTAWKTSSLAALFLAAIALAIYFTIVLHRLTTAEHTHLRDARKLMLANERVDTALNHIGDGVISTDVDGRIILMNKMALELTGWSIENAKGKLLNEVFRLDEKEALPLKTDPDGITSLDCPLFGQEETDTLRSHSGLAFTITYQVVPMQDEDHWLIGTMLSFQDITEFQHMEQQREALISELSETNRRLENEMTHREKARRVALSLLQDAQMSQSALREREEHLRTLFEGIDDTLLVCDQGGLVIDCNGAACDTLGYKRENLLGLPKQDLLIPCSEDLENVCLKTRKGPTIPVDVHTSTIRYHNQQASLSVIRDITPLKKIQYELQQSNQRLRESNVALEEYARVASHDLQEPLRKIQSFSDIVLEDYGPKLDEEGVRHLSIIKDAATRMRQLIKDVLAFSEAGSTGHTMEPIDLNDIIESVRENLSTQIAEKSAIVKAAKLPVILGDKTQVLQLFQNLVGNGIKFSDKDTPTVEIFAQEHKNEWQLVVKDNGIGMKEWEIRYIFAPFKRLHGRKVYEGTGIGLAVCRKIIHRHGGTIRVESEPEKGSAFKLTFPKTSLERTVAGMDEIETIRKTDNEGDKS